ncbi:hypothetical protein VNO77_03046 [Canavalia gladiata]|uniref:Uncharacterized protein n=1 Tax=Canavalia gladiata TaxID=3824 RepID=A0AAN9R6G8_CANGL
MLASLGKMKILRQDMETLYKKKDLPDAGIPVEAALETSKHAPKHSIHPRRTLRPIGPITKTRAKKLQTEVGP